MPKTVSRRARVVAGKKRPAQKIPEGRRVWMSRGMQIEHHDKLRKIAAFLPKDKPWGATITKAHDLVLARGLPLVMAELGIPNEDVASVA